MGHYLAVFKEPRYQPEQVTYPNVGAAGVPAAAAASFFF